MISIIIGFRNREAERVRRCFQSLDTQSFKDFELILVDYGSEESVSNEIAALAAGYDFVRYEYSETRGWFWNRSHALNTGVKLAKNGLILFGDIDLVFAPDFIHSVAALSFENSFYTFDCSYMSAEESVLETPWLQQKDWTQNYVGLCAATKQQIETAGYYTEFYMVWGVEDYDFYEQLSLNGATHKKLGAPAFRVFHQWHATHYDPKPTLWYVSMVDAMYMHKLPGQEQAGQLISAAQRPCLQAGLGKATSTMQQLTLFGNGLLLFDVFYKEFQLIENGGFAFVEFLEADSVKGRLQSLISKTNNLLSYMPGFNYQLVSRNKPTTVITLRDVKDFLTYFIGMYRHLVADYFVEIKEDSLLLILQKK